MPLTLLVYLLTIAHYLLPITQPINSKLTGDLLRVYFLAAFLAGPLTSFSSDSAKLLVLTPA